MTRLFQRLELLDGYLKEFDAATADRVGSQVQWQKKIDTPWKVTDQFPAGEDSKGLSAFGRECHSRSGGVVVEALFYLYRKLRGEGGIHVDVGAEHIIFSSIIFRIQMWSASIIHASTLMISRRFVNDEGPFRFSSPLYLVLGYLLPCYHLDECRVDGGEEAKNFFQFFF